MPRPSYDEIKTVPHAEFTYYIMHRLRRSNSLVTGHFLTGPNFSILSRTGLLNVQPNLYNDLSNQVSYFKLRHAVQHSI